MPPGSSEVHQSGFSSFGFVSSLIQQQRIQVGLRSLCGDVYAFAYNWGQSSAVFPVLHCMDFDGNARTFSFFISK
jgi:hypothetical protein